ncbi:50S ribosomal protein L19e [Candidatus Woesearchaeota archaeon]|nr:50S ribosomal protein L19e [Candidatus Woesearchaeota archaeon]
MKHLVLQKRLSSQIMKVGKTRVWFDPDRLSEIKEAITKADVRRLINDLAIQSKPQIGNSRFRIRKKIVQKSKGRQKGAGSRRGKKTSRMPKKLAWINRVRSQRLFLKELKEKNLISKSTFRTIYSKVKGGFFRSKRHIKVYLTDSGLFTKK